jgi:hypothetical protein
LGKAFIQRDDIFASQLDDGRYVAIKEPLTEKHLVLHLESQITLGTYMMTKNNTSRIMVLDADQEDGLKELSRLATVLAVNETPSYLETSRRGGHLWFFFNRPYDGVTVRAFGKALMALFKIENVELFPKQDWLGGGPGSLVRLPFGKHKLTGRIYTFIQPDGKPLAPTVRSQIDILSSPKTVSEALLLAYGTYSMETPKKQFLKASGVSLGSSDIEKVKNAIPLLDFVSQYIELKPVASGAVGHCPFHDDQHASFGVNAKRNYWHCFAGCGGGSIIDFWMKLKNIEFPQAVNELANLLGVRK